MEKSKLIFALIIGLAVTIVGAGLSVVFSRFIHLGEVKGIQTRTTGSNVSGGSSAAPSPFASGGFVYDPPNPQDAPASLQEAVRLGYNIMAETQKYAGRYVGNKLRCSDCHFKGGITQGGKNGGISLVGVAGSYPAYEEKEKSVVDLAAKTNSCFQTSMNGKPLPSQGKEMRAILAYYQWISRGLPIYGKIPWLGLKPIESSHVPDKGQGAQVFAQKCSACHGSEGRGTQAGPPLWGPQSFNDGAGMAKPENLSAFAYLNMPPGNPDLTKEQALDVGIFATSQERPHLAKR